MSRTEPTSGSDLPHGADANQAPSDVYLRGRALARRMRILNVLMRRLLLLPFPTPINRQLMLLYYTGRTSGRAYRQPVSYIRHRGTLLTPGGGRWTLNLHEDQAIRIRLRGHVVTARPELTQNATEVATLLRTMMISNPRLTSFVPFIGPDQQIDPAQLTEALDHGFCIVRWHLAPPSQQ